MQLLLQLRRGTLPQGFDEGLALLDVVVDLRSMVVVVGQCRVDIGQSQVVLSGNLINAFADPLMPDHDVLHRNPMPCNARLPASYSRGYLDMTKPSPVLD